MPTNVHDNVLASIGNTPLIRLNRLTSQIEATVYAKIESTNPGNSTKDRMAVRMIEDAEAKPSAGPWQGRPAT